MTGQAALEETYAPSRSTFDVNVNVNAGPSQVLAPRKADAPVPAPLKVANAAQDKEPLFLPDEQVGESHSPLPHDGHGIEGGPGQSEFGEPALLLGSAPSEPGPSRAPGGEEDRTVVDTEREGPRSPTVTQMQMQMVNEDARDDAPPLDSGDRDGGGAPEVQGEDEDRDRDKAPPASQQPLVKVLEARRGAAAATVAARREQDEEAGADEDTDNTPIPSLRPPVRPVARAPESLRAKAGGSGPSRGGGGGGGGEQTVLSTSGASWNLRRKADAGVPGGAERPSKKSRVEGKEAQAGMRVMLSQFARMGSRVEEVEVAAAADDGVEMDNRRDVKDEPQDEEEFAAGGGGDDAREPAGDELEDVEMREAAEIEMELSDGMTLDEDGRMEEERPVAIDITPDNDVVPVRPRAKRTGGSDVGQSTASATSDEIVRTSDHESITIAVDLSSLTASWQRLRERLADALRQREVRERDAEAKLDGTAGLANADDEAAVEALSRVIDKPDFATMVVIGQFNLGFIVVRRCKPAAVEDGAFGEEMAMDDLFIVDQHAADEKYNFETLQQTTKIESQQMIR